jgi:hypothetical protein
MVEVFNPTSTLVKSGHVEFVLPITYWHQLHRKHRFQQFLYCCMWICCCRNTSVLLSLPSNRSTRCSMLLVYLHFIQVWLCITSYLNVDYSKKLQLHHNNIALLHQECLGKVRARKLGLSVKFSLPKKVLTFTGANLSQGHIKFPCLEYKGDRILTLHCLLHLTYSRNVQFTYISSFSNFFCSPGVKFWIVHIMRVTHKVSTLSIWSAENIT